ncbi:hypothetical protein ScPMuIL_009343 [Solemya velum]
MHFSIPDTQDIPDKNNSCYTSYNIHINGVFHCTVRYSLLHGFHEQLKKEFGTANLPPFPPKKLLSLTPVQVDERRVLLERYIQTISQDLRIAKSDMFNSLLLSAQQETLQEEPENVTLDIFLMNGHKILTNIMSTDQTDEVLESIASQIDLPDELVYYFALFLIKKEGEGENSIVRRLQGFESPYISLKASNKNNDYKIVLRKCFWDSAFDDEILENKVAMNLLYVQAVNDIERQWVLATKDQLKHLSSLQQKGSKREYLRVARTLKYYGYLQFLPCVTDYPQPNCRTLIAVGNRELNMRIQVEVNSIKEGSFKITRMKCWRITTIVNGPLTNGDTNDSHTSKARLELSFEYLMAKDTLKWITVTSDQAILISMCLQSMVDELLLKKQGGKFKRATGNLKNNFHRENSAASPLNHQGIPSSPTEEKVKRQTSAQQAIVANDAFETIGDDDL